MKTLLLAAAAAAMIGLAAPVSANDGAARGIAAENANLQSQDLSSRHRRWHRHGWHGRRHVRVCKTHWRHGRRVTVCRYR